MLRKNCALALTTQLQLDLLTHLLKEIEAMIIWALTNGLEVPSDLTEEFYFILQNIQRPDENKHIGASQLEALGTIVSSEQCDEEKLRKVLQDDDDTDLLISELVDIHHAMTAIIKPAKPRTVALMYCEQKKKTPLMFLGPVPLIRQLVAMAVFFLIVLYTLGQSELVNVDAINLSILKSTGPEQLYNQGFLLACAGLGSVFSCLFQAMGYVTNGSYDPKFNVAYWVRIILGLMAGLILVELIPESIISQGPMEDFGKPTIALLGGFSATVVHKLLQRFVDMLAQFVEKLPGASDPSKTGDMTPADAEELEKGRKNAAARAEHRRKVQKSRKMLAKAAINANASKPEKAAPTKQPGPVSDTTKSEANSRTPPPSKADTPSGAIINPPKPTAKKTLQTRPSDRLSAKVSGVVSTGAKSSFKPAPAPSPAKKNSSATRRIAARRSK